MAQFYERATLTIIIIHLHKFTGDDSSHCKDGDRITGILDLIGERNSRGNVIRISAEHVQWEFFLDEIGLTSHNLEGNL